MLFCELFQYGVEFVKKPSILPAFACLVVADICVLDRSDEAGTNIVPAKRIPKCWDSNCPVFYFSILNARQTSFRVVKNPMNFSTYFEPLHSFLDANSALPCCRNRP